MRGWTGVRVATQHHRHQQQCQQSEDAERVAAALSNGVALEEFGAEINDAVRLPSLETPLRIIHIDRFGNCVTNIRRDSRKRLVINGQTISEFRRFYGEGDGESLFAIWGSAGFLEISVNGGSAAKILHAGRGDEVSFT